MAARRPHTLSSAVSSRLSYALTEGLSGGTETIFTPIPTLASGTKYRAYFMKRVEPAYSGPIIRINNATDTSPLDIYALPNSNELNLSAVPAWLAANSTTYAEIDRQYDQFGSGDYCAQTTSNNRPILTLNYNVRSQIGAKFDRKTKSNPYFNLPVGLTGSTQSVTVVNVAAMQCTNAGGVMQLGTAAPFLSIMTGYGDNPRGLYFQNGSGAFHATFRARTQYMVSAVACGASNTRFYMDANVQTDVAATAGTWTGGYLGRSNNSSEFFQGEYGGTLIYSSQVSDADMTTLRAYLNPLFDIQTTFPAHLILSGNSLMQGTGSTFNQDAIRQIENSFTKRIMVCNQGVYGYSLAQQNTDITSIYVATASGSPATGNKLFVSIDPTNDIQARASGSIVGYGATLYTTALSNINTMKAAGCIAALPTVQARGWTGTPTDIAQREAERLDYNSRVVSGAAANGYTALDFAGRSELNNATDTTYFDPDQIHLNNAGYAVRGAVLLPFINANI